MNGKDLLFEPGSRQLSKKLKRILLASTVAFLATSINAKAQTAPDQSLCGITSPAILGGITGSWSLSQGPGVAVAGPGLVIPLPPHPAQAMDFTLDGDMHAVRMAGGSPRQEILMLPVEDTAARMVMDAIQADETDGFMDTATDCDTGTLPMLVGSNTYSFAGHEVREDMYTVGIGMTGVDPMIFCVPKSAIGDGLVNPDPDSLFDVEMIGTEDMGAVLADESGVCQKENTAEPEPVSGGMVMTVTVKFHTPEHASGWLTFNGEQDGYAFAASAPIEMTR